MKEEFYEKASLKKVIDWYENGQRASEVERDGALNHGNYIVWYENGNKKEHRIYKRHQLNGKWTGWYINGIKRIEGNVKYRKMEGKWTFWWPNGKKECECEFALGVPYAGAKVWHNNGVLKKKISFEDEI